MYQAIFESPHLRVPLKEPSWITPENFILQLLILTFICLIVHLVASIKEAAKMQINMLPDLEDSWGYSLYEIESIGLKT